MIYIGLGANLPSKFGSPFETLKAAKMALEQYSVTILKQSGTWLSAPVPFDEDQPWFHNEIVAVETDLTPQGLLDVLLEIEKDFGRVRSVKNAPRLLDMDLIAYHDEIIKNDERLIVPHPRMHERLFVLKPLAECDKNWTHPVTDQKINDLIADIGEEQEIKCL